MKTQPDNSGREMESGPVLLHGADSPSMWHIETYDNPDVALCGFRLTGEESVECEEDLSDVDCIVCVELSNLGL